MNYSEYLVDLCESPQSISPVNFGLDNIVKNKELLQKLLKDSRLIKFKSTFNTGELYKAGNTVFLVDGDIINYLVQYEIKKVRALKCLAAVQVKVWRGPTVDLNFPTFIFFGHVLEQAGVIVTDMLQTEDGKRFWSNRIIQAFDLDLHVYYVDMLDPVKIVELKTKEDFYKLLTDVTVWGDQSKHKARRLVISKKKLQ